jgi:hypothetical protein
MYTGGEKRCILIRVSMFISFLRKRPVIAAALAGTLILATGHAAPGELDRLRQGFLNPPDDARVMMRWWWFGSAVVKPELEREMRVMKAGGLGGFEIQPVYPVELDDPQTGFVNLPYLSAGYLDALKFTADKARELGMRMDVTLGSGWPFGGPHTPVTEAAGALRCDRIEVKKGATSVPMPSIGNGEQFITAFVAQGDRRKFEPTGIHQLSASAIQNGRIDLPSGLDGDHVVLAFISSRTGQQVKRAAVGAEGFVLDHYNAKAINDHLQTVGTKLMTAFGPHPPYAVFSDSLEVFASDWTPDMLAEFHKRRGYDLTPYLPALVGDMGDKTAAVRRDWGKTLTELCEERYLTPINEWAHAHGTKFRSQTYGVPPVTMSSNALVDLPEGEHGPAWRQFSAARWASSASHIYGRPVTSSETWTWLHSPSFRATPLDMKAEADLHFLSGINQLIGHGWAYSPASAGEPGWRFYAAAVFNEHNPWWIVMPDVTKYLQRMSWLMRQGKPANDVAIYLPTDDAYATFHAGDDSVDRTMERLLGTKLIPQVLDAGYNFDFIDDGAIAKAGITYPVLILPDVERMPLASLRKINDYAAKGGIAIAFGKLPSLAPGLQDAADTPQIASIAAAMKVHKMSELTSLLQPDFATGVPAIGFTHRKLDDADVYFVANTGNQPVHTKAVLRAPNSAGEWMDPFSGDVTAASPGNLAVDLEPYESRVLILGAGVQAPPPAHAPAGPPVDISSGWKVTFDKLNYSNGAAGHSWTEDPRTQYFSGTATYEKTVNVAASATPVLLDFGAGTPLQPTRMANGMRAWLDPPVREAATVYVNDKLAGYVWKAPFQVDIAKFVHPGANDIRIVVANTAINELAGQSLPDYKLLKLEYGDRFQPQDMNNLQPLPSGILGSITLR